jgi:uncharacterized protein (DUF1697 family)
MNLGRRRIKNDELVQCFLDLCLRGATAFLASGNVVFDASGSAAALAKRIERGLAQALEYDVPTFVRSAKEIHAVAVGLPFAGRPDPTKRGKPQVCFLKATPPPTQAKAAARFDCDADWLSIQGRELYWWPSGGLSESDLDLAGLEKLLGPMTIRTHGTVERLVKRFF